MPKKGISNPNWKGGLQDVFCKECNKKFQLKKKNILSNGNSCSRTCSATFQFKLKSLVHFNNRFIKNCIICNKEIRVKQSHKDIEGTYCSKACMSIGYAKYLNGERNPNYRHGKAHINNYYSEQRKNVEGSYPKGYDKKLLILQKELCIICRKKLTKYHIDHIHPIALGGSNYKENLQLLCPSCNCQKHAKDPIHFMQEKGYLL
jgi:5-methylcytosine-specific restriction endonuclease McrA